MLALFAYEWRWGPSDLDGLSWMEADYLSRVIMENRERQKRELDSKRSGSSGDGVVSLEEAAARGMTHR